MEAPKFSVLAPILYSDVCEGLLEEAKEDGDEGSVQDCNLLISRLRDAAIDRFTYDAEVDMGYIYFANDLKNKSLETIGAGSHNLDVDETTRVLFGLEVFGHKELFSKLKACSIKGGLPGAPH